MNNNYESESSRTLRRLGHVVLWMAIIALIAMLIMTAPGLGY